MISTDRARVLIQQRSIPEPTSGCWLWERALTSTGYGLQWVPEMEQLVLAHRLSHYGATGDWPPCVRHRCDNPPCVNPEHLLGGTVFDNNHDMMRRGRFRRVPAIGEGNGCAKLTSQDVKAIRSLAGIEKQRDIAARFGVSQSVVWAVINRLTWRHVT